MSPEEFFMYLIIGLIVAIPVSARLYRYLTAKRVARMVDDQFGQPPAGDRPEKR
ncbi:MAG TPA: hypothetical protein VGA17_04870 [Nitrospiraceae bacterium]|jgi:hypothetical protein